MYQNATGKAIHDLFFSSIHLKCQIKILVSSSRPYIVRFVVYFCLEIGSLQAHSIAASKVEQALSEVASSMSSFSPRPGPQRAWLLQLEVWLLLAELYLSLDQLPAVQQCIQEATQIFPLSHHIMHMVNNIPD